MSAQKLNKTPVYQQLNELLRELIRSGELKPGDQFLTERQIATRFEVSRATANKALSNLVSEGLLLFRKGVGTFVQPGTLDVDLRMLVSFTARAEAAGRNPATRVLAFARKKAAEIDPLVADRLRLSGNESVIFIERLRLADSQPVIFERRYLVEKHVLGMDAQSAAGSLYGLFTDAYHLRIAGADQTIRAISLDTADAERLGTRRGTAALEVSGIGQLESGEPLWYELTLYRGDSYAFHNRVGNAAPRTGPAFELIAPRS
jgi:GntR family transcriptional regulator